MCISVYEENLTKSVPFHIREGTGHGSEKAGRRL
jgi:hypothetical protein